MRVDQDAESMADGGPVQVLAALPTRLGAREVHLWQCPLLPGSAQEAVLQGLLSADERQRAQRLQLEQDRRAFVGVRGILRLLLGHHLEQHPASVRFCYTPEGKPVLEGREPSLAFNVTHSGQWSLFAISRETDVGVDLERVRIISPDKCLRLARRFFASAEADALDRLPRAAVQEAFFACWTRKEAYIKCRGLTLSRLLSQCVVTVEPDVPAALLETPWRPADRSGCQIHDLPAPPGYRAALALASTAPFTFRHHQWGEAGAQ